MEYIFNLRHLRSSKNFKNTNNTNIKQHKKTEAWKYVFNKIQTLYDSTKYIKQVKENLVP